MISRFPLAFAIAGVSLVLDQLTKWGARTWLSDGFVGYGFFQLELVFNTGAAYGILANATSALLWVGVLVIAYLVFRMQSLIKHPLDNWVYGFILGGAIGNTLDRMVFSQVTDFINIQIVPVFNLADVWLNLGVFCMLLQVVMGYGKKRSKR